MENFNIVEFGLEMDLKFNNTNIIGVQRQLYLWNLELTQLKNSGVKSSNSRRTLVFNTIMFYNDELQKELDVRLALIRKLKEVKNG